MRTFLIIYGLVSLLVAGPGHADPLVIRDRPSTLLNPPFWHTPFGIHTGTPELLAAFIGDRTHLDHPAGLACGPLLSTIGGDNRRPEFQLTVIGANAGRGDLIFNPALTRLEVLGDARNHPGLFQRPWGVAMTRLGTVVITDPKAPTVQRCLFRDGRLLPAEPLTPPPGGWSEPTGVAVDSTGRIYVSDRGRNQILVFSTSGALETVLGPDLGPDTRLDRPGAVAVADPGERWSYYHGQFLIVVDLDGERLLRLTPTGLAETRVMAGDLPLSDPTPRFGWVALDYYEQVWVTDPVRGQVHKFTRQLQPLVSLDNPSGGRFRELAGIAIYRHFGQVFIAEAQAAHYFWIGADILDLDILRLPSERGPLQVRFLLTEPSQVTCSIRADDAPPEAAQRETRRLDAGRHLWVWTDDPARGRRPLTIELTAEATYSSARHMLKQVTRRISPLNDTP